MTKQLKMLAGVAMLAILALAGTLGIFAFSAAQSVEAQTVPVTRSFSTMQVEPGGTVNVTITFTGFLSTNVTETLPDEWTYQSVMPSDVTVTQSGQVLSFSVLNGQPVTYTVMAPTATGDHVFMGTYTVGSDTTPVAFANGTVTVEADGGTTPDPMPGDREFSVNARPTDPGAATQITVKFNNPSFIPIDGSITFEVEDDLGVPATIEERHVSIDGMGAEDADDAGSAQVAAPASVIVEYNAPEERHEITLFIADMSTGSSDAEASDDGLAEGQVAVTFRQGSGITNRTEGSIQDGDRGADDWFVYTSESPDMVKIHDHGMVYDVPFLVELSSYADKRGDEITATGKGFKNGTTTYFLLDNDGTDGFNLATDTVICKDDAVGGNDIAVCTFTLTNPPFDPGEGNMINAVDGRGNAAETPVAIELEPSLDVSPSRGNPGDSINVQLQDFPPDDTVDPNRVRPDHRLLRR